MSTILISNKSYQGTTPLPNLIDRLTTVDEQSAFLKSLLNSDGLDSKAINPTNTPSLFNSLKSYRARVVADGGIVVSLGHTLNALIFANANSISAADYTAYSAAFGLKIAGNTITKIYDLSSNACDMTATLGSATKAIDSNHAVIKAVGTTNYTSSKALVGANGGYVLGASSHDTNVAAGINNSIRAIMLALNASAGGTPPMTLENDNGGSAKVAYTNIDDLSVTTTFPTSGATYKPYSGVSALVQTGIRASLYENGVLKVSSGSSAKNMDAISTYPSFTIYGAGSFVRESWIIRSSSEATAIALSNYLNKG